MSPRNLHHRARRAALRVAVLAAIAAPSAALANGPGTDATTGPGLEAGPERNALSELSGPFPPAIEAARPGRASDQGRRAGTKPARAAKRQRRADREGPFHPVDGEVSYGDALAAFGNARGRPHEGQDIFAPAGTPVIAPTEGVVVDAGSDGGRGNWVAVFDADRRQTYSYFHLLSPASPKIGERVRAGEKIGEIGCSGSCFGDHLHFELIDGEGPYGTPRDPMPLLRKWDRV